jgi:hypothetical protein
MKRICIGISILAMLALPAFSAMDDVDYSVAVIGSAASSTNSATYVLRGTIESVYVNVPANTTNTVTITSDQGTIFTKASITADAQYFPRAAAHTTAGAALTWTEVSSAGVTNTVTTTQFYDKIAVAGPVKVTVVGQTDTTTNTVTTTIIINK